MVILFYFHFSDVFFLFVTLNDSRPEAVLAENNYFILTI